MNVMGYVPGILGACAFFSMCAALAVAEEKHRRKLFYIYFFPMLVLLVRFGPYLGALEWRLAIRRPLDYACAFLPFVSILIGARLCSAWKQLEKWQAPVTAVALISCFCMGCILSIGQFPLNSYDSCYGYVKVQGEQMLVVQENKSPGSHSMRKFYPYVNEVFRRLAEVERDVPY